MEGDISISEFNEDDDEPIDDQIDSETELEMLTEECEELIGRLSTCAGVGAFMDEQSEQE
jgi:hypothetical protein